jgi:hypothetical protein
MPANQTNELIHLWSGRYPGALGHLYTPARKERIRPWLPYVLDNGRFAEAVAGKPFNESGFLEHLGRYAFLEQRPRWVVVPDVPFDGDATVEWWKIWAPRLADYKVPLALAVQDGMSVDQVRSINPDVIFVGGTTEWKWRTVAEWCRGFPRVHVGRVNSLEKLELLKTLGAESCDGSGWFRGKSPQIVGLAKFLARAHGYDVEAAAQEALATRFTSGYQEQTVLHLFDQWEREVALA